MKLPCVIIVGPKDVEASEVSVRLRDSEEKIKLADLKAFIEKL
jgi:threonyl-tRNA synthetase